MKTYELDISQMDLREQFEAMHELYKWSLDHCNYFIGVEIDLNNKIILTLKDPPKVSSLPAV